MSATSLSDPLLVLRSVLSSEPTSLFTYLDSASRPTPSLSSATHLLLPSSPPQTFPKNVPTRFTSASTEEASTYDLATLVFAWLSRDQGVGEYLKNARDEQVGFVAITDRRTVLDYLAGKLGDVQVGARILHEGIAHPGPTATSAPVAEHHRKRPLEPTTTLETSTTPSATILTTTTSQPTLPTTSATTTTTAAQDRDSSNRPLKKPAYQTDPRDLERMKRLMQIVQGPVYANLAPDHSKVEPTGFAIKNRETNFESVLTLLAPRLKLIKDDHFEARPSASSSSTTPAAGTTPSSSGKNRRKALNPIIMLSPSETALLNLYNIKAFLERSQYVEPSKAKLEAGGEETDMVIVHHARVSSTIASSIESRNGTTNDPNAALRGGAGGARYFVVNSVEALAKFGSLDDAWDRVVCVMTTGQEWQFRPYKWREPKELFHHVKGVFVQYTHEAPNPKIRSWNVTELRVDRNNRHIDKSTVADFWRSLDAWIAMYKPHLHV